MLFFTFCKDKMNHCPEMRTYFENVLTYVHKVFCKDEET